MKIIKQYLGVYLYSDKEWYMDWYKNDEIHREDGPSEVWKNCREYFYIKGRYYLKDNYWKEVHENY